MYLSITLIVLFFVATTMAMYQYPGGTILDRSSEGYQFFQNFFSDLGRRRAWNGAANTASNYLFDYGLYGAGVGLMIFFASLPFVFRQPSARGFAIVTALLGGVAALAYYGIVAYPLDVDYRLHTLFVRLGFIAFLIMGIFYVLAIRQEKGYPSSYAYAFLFFDLLLFSQICIMLLGPRSWSSPLALSLQVTAQKIIVYAQLLCLLYQCYGVLTYLRLRNTQRNF